MPNDPPDVTNGAPHPESYTDNGDGTVTDNVTGLMWQQSVSSTFFNWGSVTTSGTAQSYCANLMLGGHNDWRLPTVIELISIVEYSQFPSAVMINQTYFPGLPAPIFLASTPGLNGFGWTVYFDEGDSQAVPLSGLTTGLARCVR